MARYTEASESRLSTVREDLAEVFRHVLMLGFDHTITCGVRHKAEQNEMFRIGRSEKRWPDSKHNAGLGTGRALSAAVDAVPCPIDWSDRERFSYFAGVIIGVGRVLGVDIRWGGDWDGDWEVRDNKFDDLGHFEVRGG